MKRSWMGILTALRLYYGIHPKIAMHIVKKTHSNPDEAWAYYCDRDRDDRISTSRLLKELNKLSPSEIETIKTGELLR